MHAVDAACNILLSYLSFFNQSIDEQFCWNSIVSIIRDIPSLSGYKELISLQFSVLLLKNLPQHLAKSSL
jgi:hypothetical protein